MKELHEVTDALKKIEGICDNGTKKWSIEYNYWSKGGHSRIYLNLNIDNWKVYKIGYIDINNMGFVFSPCGSYNKEAMRLAKESIEKILQ